MRFKDIFRYMAVGTIGIAAGAWISPAVHAQNAKPNVVLIALDQLRAGELHCYGNPRPTSPNIDKLAAQGVLFSDFYTVAPWTSPSFATLHTSLYPSRHGVTLFWRPGMPLLNKDTPTLAEALQAAGYFTAAFVNNAFGGKALTGEGFDEFVEGSAESREPAETTAASPGGAPYTAQEVLAWLAKHHSDARPFFLYIHLLEPHSPYNPPPQDDLFRTNVYPYLSNAGYDLAQGGLLRLATNGDEKAVERLYQLYDGKIHYVDRYVGQILDSIQSLGLKSNTYILLTSDHGELLYSHPNDFLTFDHRSLYDTVLHIPLIVEGPGIPQGRVEPALASNIDTAPTVLNLVGVPPLSDAEGHSLVPVLHGKTATINDYVFAEEDVEIPERSVRNKEYKLIRNLWTGKDQLFDLKRDAAELHNVAGENPSIVKNLQARLTEWMRVNQPSGEVRLRREKIYTATQSMVTVDDITIGAAFLITDRQAWHSDEDPASGNFGGTSYWTEAGDGTRTAVWRGDNPFVGKYKVFIYAGEPRIGSRSLATNAPFTVVAEHETHPVTINLQQDIGQWRLLGVFENPRYVELSNKANGIVVADAVRFERTQ